MYLAVKETLRNVEGKKLDKELLYLMVRSNQIPIIKVLAGSLLFLPGWYIFYCFVVLCCLGTKVYEDPELGGSGAHIVKYRAMRYRWEDIA